MYLVIGRTGDTFKIKGTLGIRVGLVDIWGGLESLLRLEIKELDLD